MHIKSRFALVMIGVVAFQLAQAGERPLMRVAPCRVPPVIDGAIGKEEWQDANMNAGFVGLNNNILVPRKGWFWFTYDKENVYIAVRTEAPPEGNLVAKKTHRDDLVAYDDAVEIWLNPNLAKGGRYYQLLVNSIGTVYDKMFDTARPERMEWTCNCKTASKVGKDFWEMEIAIPFKDLETAGPIDGTVWSVHVGRDWQQSMEFSDWSGSGNYVDVNQMGKVVFDRNAPVVQVLSLGDPHETQSVGLKVRLANPGQKDILMTAKLDFLKDKQQMAGKEDKITLKPGENRELSIGQPFMYGKDNRLIVKVTAADDPATVYYYREIAFMEAQKPYWAKAGEIKKEPLVCKFYPSKNCVLAEIDVGAITNMSGVSRSWLKVTRKGETNALASGEMVAFKENRGDLLISLPALEEGGYCVTACFFDEQGKPGLTTVKEFEKKKWEWEGNTIGISDEVIPPFTPLEVKGKTVESVLRKHEMNDLGFWNRVESKGKQILARPMVLECRQNGKVLGWKEAKIEFTEKLPSRVRVKSEFGNGVVKGEVHAMFDYDGFMKVEMEIMPVKDEVIDGLSLLIPLKPEIAKLMHAVSDTGSGPAGLVPAGSGIVWGSKQSEHRLIETSFIPYIWVGEEERGICWLADTDRDWVIRKDASAVEIERNPKEVILKVNLISDRTQMSRPLKYVFALQATPVKPMPPDWRRWFYSYGSPSTNTRSVAVEGYFSGEQWGYYPWGNDYTLIKAEMEARKTGKINEKAVADWKAKWLNNLPKKKFDSLNGTIDWAMRTAAGLASFKDSNLLAYNNGVYIPAIEECKYYSAEWANGVNYSAVQSYRDFAVWYFAKMMDLGYDGMYIDGAHPYSVSDWVVGEAWRDEDGKVHAGCRGFNAREYIKRLAVMMHQKGKPYALLVHMTGAMVIPVISFANITLDWEMRYGVQDYQDRFPLDFIRAESIGRQCGTVPIVLGGIVGEESREQMKRLSRTFLAVMLPHELRAWIARTDAEEISKAQKVLLDFGAYTATDDEFVPYWSQEKLSRDNRIISYYRKNGKILAIIANMGDARTFAVPADAFGLKMIAKAVDAEQQKILEVKNNAVVVPIPKHDYRLVLIQAVK